LGRQIGEGAAEGRLGVGSRSRRFGRAGRLDRLGRDVGCRRRRGLRDQRIGGLRIGGRLRLRRRLDHAGGRFLQVQAGGQLLRVREAGCRFLDHQDFLDLVGQRFRRRGQRNVAAIQDGQHQHDDGGSFNGLHDSPP